MDIISFGRIFFSHAIGAMKEIGINISEQYPKTLDKIPQ